MNWVQLLLLLNHHAAVPSHTHFLFFPSVTRAFRSLPSLACEVTAVQCNAESNCTVKMTMQRTKFKATVPSFLFQESYHVQRIFIYSSEYFTSRRETREWRRRGLPSVGESSGSVALPQIALKCQHKKMVVSTVASSAVLWVAYIHIPLTKRTRRG